MRNSIINKVFAGLLLLLTLTAVSAVYARGGQAADDCPPGSKDPDCVAGK